MGMWMGTSRILGLMRGRAAVVAVMAGAVFSAPGAYAASLALANHQAAYKITLASAASGGGVASAAGAVLYRFADACEGWTVENRTILRVTGEEGDVSETVWAYTSWESKDGLNFRVRVRETRNGDLTDDLRGKASLERLGGSGKAKYRAPSEAEIDLPAGTQFPTGHMRGLLEKARAGERYVPATVFDGADLDNPYRVGTVLGSAADGVRAGFSGWAGLTDMPVWSIQMAFFPVDGPAAVPMFEIGANYREDGIADAILQDFGGLVLRLKLENVELLPDPGC